jgi:hypothetical protein
LQQRAAQYQDLRGDAGALERIDDVQDTSRHELASQRLRRSVLA